MKTLRLTILYIIFFNTTSLLAQMQLGKSIFGYVSGYNAIRGMSLSNDGTHVVIGSTYEDLTGEHSGQVRVFEWENNNWYQIGQTIKGQDGDYFGKCVDISKDGNIIAVGALETGGWGDILGWVSVYQLVGDQWLQLGDTIKGDDAAGMHGYAVSISEDGLTVAIGSENSTGGLGRIRVFRFQNGIWDKLGDTFIGTSANDNIGRNVSLSANGNRVAFGIQGATGPLGEIFMGFCQVWELVGNSWVQLGNNIYGEAPYNAFGWSVELAGSGNRLVASSVRNNDGGEDAGHARVFEYISGDWQQLGDDVDGEAAYEHCGSSVSLSYDGNILAIGANRSNQNGFLDGGSTRVLKLENDAWIQITPTIYGNLEYQSLGDVVCLSASGDRIAISSPGQADPSLQMPRFTQVFQLPVASKVQTPLHISFSVFPNPNSGVFRIEGIGSGLVQLFDSMGRLQRTWRGNNSVFDISDLPVGMYQVSVSTGEETWTQLILKKNP